MMALEQYFAEWDPMDFIKELDAPSDEYAQEAEKIVEKYDAEMSSEQVGELTYTVFVEMIEDDFDGFREEAVLRGEEIKKILDNSKV